MKKLFRSRLFGIPMLYIGVLIMVAHFFFHISSNLLLVIALLLEVAGAAIHFYKIRH